MTTYIILRHAETRFETTMGDVHKTQVERQKGIKYAFIFPNKEYFALLSIELPFQIFLGNQLGRRVSSKNISRGHSMDNVLL